MPCRKGVVLADAAYGTDSWLDRDVQNSEDVAAIVARAQIDFGPHPVSAKLNTAKNDDEGLSGVDPISWILFNVAN